jgi:hypothetical protein
MQRLIVGLLLLLASSASAQGLTAYGAAPSPSPATRHFLDAPVAQCVIAKPCPYGDCVILQACPPGTMVPPPQAAQLPAQTPPPQASTPIAPTPEPKKAVEPQEIVIRVEVVPVAPDKPASKAAPKAAPKKGCPC